MSPHDGVQTVSGILSQGRELHLADARDVGLYDADNSFVEVAFGRYLTNTTGVLRGDQGWKLGEYGSWCKQTNIRLQWPS